jgi:hypothetical protein
MPVLVAASAAAAAGTALLPPAAAKPVPMLQLALATCCCSEVVSAPAGTDRLLGAATSPQLWLAAASPLKQTGDSCSTREQVRSPPCLHCHCLSAATAAASPRLLATLKSSLFCTSGVVPAAAGEEQGLLTSPVLGVVLSPAHLRDKHKHDSRLLHVQLNVYYGCD